MLFGWKMGLKLPSHAYFVAAKIKQINIISLAYVGEVVKSKYKN
jgi:hypothetical protein